MAKLEAALLSDLPPFRGIDTVGLDGLLTKAEAVRREKGHRVFEQGDPVDTFFLLLDGHVRVVKMNPQGEQIIIRYISSGELLGIGQALSLTRYPASAIAARDLCAVALARVSMGQHSRTISGVCNQYLCDHWDAVAGCSGSSHGNGNRTRGTAGRPCIVEVGQADRPQDRRGRFD